MNNWSDYPILIAVAETGSLTAAGRKLKMSQPTVGRRIRALEDHFGTRLVTKEKGTLVPTTFGYSILEHARRMQDEAAAIDRSSATLEHSLAGTVRISATEGIGTTWLPPVMQAFRRNHPDIMLDLGIGFKNFNLAQRESDIAIRWMGPGDQNSLIGRKVATVTFGLYASKDYLDARGTPHSLEDLKDHDAVLATIMDDKVLWLQDSNGAPMHLPDRISLRTNSIWAMDQAMQAGYGIGVSVLCSDCIIGDSNMVRVLPNLSRQEDLYLVAHEDLRRSTRIRAVFDFLIDAFHQDAAVFLNGGPSVFETNNMQCGADNSPNHTHVLTSKEAAE